jgi:hypothetical protein
VRAVCVVVVRAVDGRIVVGVVVRAVVDGRCRRLLEQSSQSERLSVLEESSVFERLSESELVLHKITPHRETRSAANSVPR